MGLISPYRYLPTYLVGSFKVVETYMYLLVGVCIIVDLVRFCLNFQPTLMINGKRRTLRIQIHSTTDQRRQFGAEQRDAL